MVKKPSCGPGRLGWRAERWKSPITRVARCTSRTLPLLMKRRLNCVHSSSVLTPFLCAATKADLSGDESGNIRWTKAAGAGLLLRLGGAKMTFPPNTSSCSCLQTVPPGSAPLTAAARRLVRYWPRPFLRFFHLCPRFSLMIRVGRRGNHLICSVVSGCISCVFGARRCRRRRLRLHVPLLESAVLCSLWFSEALLIDHWLTCLLVLELSL